MYKSENFCIGFTYPRTKSHHGVIYFQGDSFANTWCQTGWGEGRDGWVVNRDGKAFEMSLPEVGRVFDSCDDILDYLEKWYRCYYL